MRNKKYYVYILANYTGTTLYIGVTSKLAQRVWDHVCKTYPSSFTARYNVKRLVHFEQYDDPASAIAREKQLKGGSRSKKLQLIRTHNPFWVDLQVPQDD